MECDLSNMRKPTYDTIRDIEVGNPEMAELYLMGFLTLP